MDTYSKPPIFQILIVQQPLLCLRVYWIDSDKTAQADCKERAGVNS